MYDERIIRELQKAHGKFFNARCEANDTHTNLALSALTDGLMAMTEAMIQSELRAQEFMRQARANQAAATAPRELLKPGQSHKGGN